MKASIVSLFELDGNKMPDSARIDLLNITIDQVFITFASDDIQRWIRANHEMGFRTFHRFVYIQDKLRSALVKNDNPKLIGTINGFTESQCKEFDFCCKMWEAAITAFLHCASDKSTLDLLLKYNERMRIVSNTMYPPDADVRPNAYSYDQSMEGLSTILRKRKRDIGGFTPVLGLVVSGTLPTSLSSRNWTIAIQNLSACGYVGTQYLSDINLIESWLFAALSFCNEEALRSGSLQKLKWTSTPKALAEFIMGMREVGFLDYDLNDKTLLYQWIDTWIDYEGLRSSLVTYLKTDSVKMKWFEIQSEPFEFTIHSIARKVKQSKS